MRTRPAGESGCRAIAECALRSIGLRLLLLAGAAIGLSACGSASATRTAPPAASPSRPPQGLSPAQAVSPAHTPQAVSPARAARCPTPAATSRATVALKAAVARYRTESRGKTIHADLRQIAHDSILLAALRKGDLRAALAQANRQLVRHVVRIRVLQGSRVLVDANPASFDVGGAETALYARDGRLLGQLQITVQDVIGFIKLVHKLNAADVVVRGARHEVRTSLPAAARLSLPRSGCRRIGTREYVVRTFQEAGFAGDPLTISVLTAA
jgi:hypothetical protein